MVDEKDPAPTPAKPAGDAPPPNEAFATVVALRRLAASLERSTVDEALRQGWTWAQIGAALGMTAQAAHKRLSPLRRKPLE